MQAVQPLAATNTAQGPCILVCSTLPEHFSLHCTADRLHHMVLFFTLPENHLHDAPLQGNVQKAAGVFDLAVTTSARQEILPEYSHPSVAEAHLLGCDCSLESASAAAGSHAGSNSQIGASPSGALLGASLPPAGATREGEGVSSSE